MRLAPNFSFEPLPPIPEPPAPPADAPIPHVEAFSLPGIPIKPLPPIIFKDPLGPLRDLLGTWSGKGFNVIWRPHRARAGDPPNQDRFLEINVTEETLAFEEIPGSIPNRGLLQDDIDMFGVTYLQQIADHNVKVNGKPAGLHIEPGIWARVPATTDPKEPGTVVRMASIPHGTTILAQGVPLVVNGGPKIDDINILPFPVNGGTGLHFPEQNMSQPTAFRSPAANIAGVTQAMVDNPNSVLKTAIQGLTITETTVFVISTDHTPVAGGGTSNTAFLQGAADGPNAKASKVTAIFWIEKVKGAAGQPDHLVLQYTQTVLLDFNGLSWPHVTVGTLRKKLPFNPLVAVDPKELENLDAKPSI